MYQCSARGDMDAPFLVQSSLQHRSNSQDATSFTSYSATIYPSGAETSPFYAQLTPELIKLGMFI
jgi:hypothetical protein